MARFRRLFFALLPLLSRTLLAETITVSAAVSLREALGDAAKAYETKGGDKVEMTFGASGQLAAQITNGAPVDLFISAANKQVDDLSKAGLLDDSTRHVIAGNDLVLVVPANAQGPTSFDGLKDASVKKVAIGEPKTVPAGEYAMQTLKAMKLDTALADRLVYGASVRQVLGYVERGEVSAGIVYHTDALQSGDKVKVIATADPSAHQPIVYPAALLKNSAHKQTAQHFLDYLLSSEGQSKLAAKGFTSGDNTAATTAPGK